MTDAASLLSGFFAAWRSGDTEAFGAVCAPDVHYEDPVCRAPLVGTTALAAHAARLRAGLPDVRVESTGAHVAEGRLLCAPCRVLGTHTQTLEGIPATGRPLVVHVMLYAELDTGRERLWRVRAFLDLYDAAVQTGVLPGRGSLGERALLMARGFGLRSRIGGRIHRPR